MKILIDARMYGLEHAGIGRYVENLINQLQNLDEENQYLILARKKIQLHASNFELQIVDLQHYSLKEQVVLPGIIDRLKPDIAHFPHFNVPISFNWPYVVTIHDLIKHASRGMKTTTRNPLFYWLKYAGYKKVFAHAVNGSRKIIVPSNAVKEGLLKSYNIPDHKVVVTYEGVDETFSKVAKVVEVDKVAKEILKKHKILKPYIIYTGSAYPHKNLEKLIPALKLFDDSNLASKMTLVIVSSRNVFLKRIMDYAKKVGVEKFVNFLGFVPDEELAVLYKNAKAFVFPSLSEGFGLPGVEAMAAGCPVVCSDIPVFHEIYKDAASYFNPEDVEDMARVIGEAGHMGESEREKIISKGKIRAKNFSWQKMAEETLKVYKSAT